MKYMQLRLILLGVIFGNGAMAQVKKLPPIIEKLASIKKPVITYSLSAEHLLSIPDLPENFKNAHQSILKTKDHVFIQMNGTGRLYRLDKSIGAFKWTRLDSTYFTGYNFGAINFFLDSTFYSFGGNGFWITNGILRFFNPNSKEWNHIPTSDPLYFSINMDNGNDNFYYLDTLDKKLYIQGINFSHQAIINPYTQVPNKDMLFSLDIRTGIYDTIGQLKNDTYAFLGTTPWGVLANNGIIIDVKNNSTYQLSTSKKNELRAVKENATRSNDFSISFFVDSMLYIGNYNNKIDSIKITERDLIKDKEIFYNPVESISKATAINKYNMIILVLIGIIVFLLILLFGKGRAICLITSMGYGMRNKNNNLKEEKSEIDNQISFRSSKIIEFLEERERYLLSFIFKQSSEERLTSIEEINKVIGAAQRSPEIQKRLRSDLIISINEKLSIITKSKKLVIEKQRSEFDKRSFEYFIQPEFMDLVKRIIE
jgi:Sec-independent protein translocase protein TatA